MSGSIKVMMPSGKSMEEARIDPGLQQHIRSLAQAVLQHLWYPIVLLYVARRQRAQIASRALEQWGWNTTKTAILTAFQRSSVFFTVYKKVSKKVSTSITLRNGSDANALENDAARKLSSPSLSKLRRSTSLNMGSNSAMDSRRGSAWNMSSTATNLLTLVSQANGNVSTTSETNATASDTVDDIRHLDAKVKNIISMHFPDDPQCMLHVAAKGEVLYWANEPARSVLVLLSGTLVEEGDFFSPDRGVGHHTPTHTAAHPTVSPFTSAKDEHSYSPGPSLVSPPHTQKKSSGGEEREEKDEKGDGLFSMNASSVDSPIAEPKDEEAAPHRKKTETALQTLDPEALAVLSVPSSQKNDDTKKQEESEKRQTSEDGGGSDGPLRHPSGSPLSVVDGGEGIHMVYTAPAVWGEMPCLGGYALSTSLSVQSPIAIYATLSHVDYSSMITATGLLELQRALLYEALKTRELLLPYSAPMTIPRLRFCPLLTNLPEKVLKEFSTAVIPRVFPAGVRINKYEVPRYIYFIRRGLVRREPDAEAYRDGTEARCDRPAHQALLVEGHTFGELTCIFRKAVRDAYFSVNHVEAYLLPYAVLEEWIERDASVRIELEKQARFLYEVRGSTFPSLKFAPTAVNPREYLEGLLPPDGFCVTLYKKALTEKRLAPESLSRNVEPAEGGQTLQGEGRITAALLEAIQLIPVIGLVTPPTFAAQCLPHWRCMRYNAFQTILRRGEECNRVLLFFYGTAGVVVDERCYQEEEAAGVMASAHSVVPILKGQMLGFGCVRRHRWMRSVVALENDVEVWELKRSALVLLLRQCNALEAVQLAVQQVLQPLYFPPPAALPSVRPMLSRRNSSSVDFTGKYAGGMGERESEMMQMDADHSVMSEGGEGPSKSTEAAMLKRHIALDLQPLLHPTLHSLWSAHPVPALHPVSLVSHTPVYPVWKEGDFPLGESTAQVPNSRNRRLSHQVASSIVLQLSSSSNSVIAIGKAADMHTPGDLPNASTSATGESTGFPLPLESAAISPMSASQSVTSNPKRGKKLGGRPPQTPLHIKRQE